MSLGGLLFLLFNLLLDIGDAAIGLCLLDLLEALHQLESTLFLPLLLFEFLLTFLII